MTAWLLVAALLAGGSSGSADESFQAGEAAFRAGDTRTAEARYREALEADPENIGALLQLALVVSWHDRLEESIGIYERALSLDPGNLRGRLGLAKVESWTGDFDRALGLYEGVLGEHPGHREATLGLARTLAWAGKTSRAEGLYRGVLEKSPDDIEARNGLAQALSWEGRLDEALALYQRSIEQDPRNAEALAGRARVYFWQGRAPQAWQAYGAASAVSPEHREVLELKQALEDNFASNLRARSSLQVDSDDNVIYGQRAVFTFTPVLSTTVAVRYDHIYASQNCTRVASGSCEAKDPGNPGFAKFDHSRLSTRLQTLKGQASWSMKPDLALSGSAGIDRVDREGGHSTSTGTASVGANWRANDRWSLSGSLSRETFVATALTLDRGVGLVAATITAAWDPLPRLGTRLTLQRLELTDDNDRTLAAGFARWSVPLQRPRIAVTWFGRYLTYGEPGRVTGDPNAPVDDGPGQINGYFSPESYVASVAGVEVSDRFWDRLGLSAQVTLGWQRVRVFENGGAATDAVRGYHLRASYDIGRSVSVQAWFGRTNLAISGATGYSSTDAGVALRWKTGWPAPGIPGAETGPGGGGLPR